MSLFSTFLLFWSVPERAKKRSSQPGDFPRQSIAFNFPIFPAIAI
jgi:hypothetical protein